MSPFNADYIKISGHFVRTLATDQGSRAFVKALTGTARDLNQQVIAQWVEDEAAMTQLRAMGTPYGQGFFLHAPRPIGEAGALPAFAGAA